MHFKMGSVFLAFSFCLALLGVGGFRLNALQFSISFMRGWCLVGKVGAILDMFYTLVYKEHLQSN